MVRSVNHVEDEDSPDSASPTERKRVDQKGNALRSKHSETEQRRRRKINERFQILRNLIPESDQKRDKASFLLEVIQYIQFLHEKLQMYEGSCEDWRPETTKSTPWESRTNREGSKPVVSALYFRIDMFSYYRQKNNSGPVENFVDQSHLERLLSGHGDNVFHVPTSSNTENPLELELTGDSLHKPIDKLQTAENQGRPLSAPLEPPMFESVPSQPLQESFPDAEQFAQLPRSLFWRGGSYLDHCPVLTNTTDEEELKIENGEAGVSSACSQGLLNSLRNALLSSGVEANISVQLDVGKRANGGSTTAVFEKDHQNLSGFHSAPPEIDENYEHPHKRFRADQI